MEAIVNSSKIENNETSKKTENGANYVRPKYLEELKQQYLDNLDKENETVWGQRIEVVTVKKPKYNRSLRKFEGEREFKALKVGHLYFYVKDEATPNNPFTAQELKDILLEGDIGCFIEERLVTKGYRDKGEDVFASIGAAPFLENCHEWQICL